VSITYSDLAEFGLPLVTPENPDFARLADEVRNQLSSPMQQFMEGDGNAIAVLVNQSGKTVLSLAVVFRFEDAEGHRSTNHFSGPFPGGGLHDVLTGAAPVSPRTSGHIFPGSRRLITTQGVRGDNTDVIPPDANDPRRGMVGSFGWVGGRWRGAEPVSGDLLLDFAIFEDGLCVGPDQYGGFDALMAEVSERRRIATEILEALQKGASRGDIFEIVRPLAKVPPPPPPPARTGPQAHPPHPHAQHQFAQAVIHQLIQLDDLALRSVFENAARPLAIQLRRP